MNFITIRKACVFFCACVCVSACATQPLESRASKDILQLSETDFVLVVRSESAEGFDGLLLELEASQRIMKYSMSKSMIPVVVSKVIKRPSFGTGGYIKQHIRLLGWEEAQARLGDESISGDYDIDVAVSSGNPSANQKPKIDDDVVSAYGGSLNENLLDAEANISDEKDKLASDKCVAMSKDHEEQIGRAMGNLCEGHRLNHDYYTSLAEFGCRTFPKLQELAQTGIKQHCSTTDE